MKRPLIILALLVPALALVASCGGDAGNTSTFYEVAFSSTTEGFDCSSLLDPSTPPVTTETTTLLQGVDSIEIIEGPDATRYLNLGMTLATGGSGTTFSVLKGMRSGNVATFTGTDTTVDTQTGVRTTSVNFTVTVNFSGKDIKGTFVAAQSDQCVPGTGTNSTCPTNCQPPVCNPAVWRDTTCTETTTFAGSQIAGVEYQHQT